MAKKLLYIVFSVIALGGWGNPEPVNIYPEPRALPDRAVYRYTEDGEAYKLSDFPEQFVIANFLVPTLQSMHSRIGRFERIQQKSQ